MTTHTIENVHEDKLQEGLSRLKRSGFSVDGNHIRGMGVEASYSLTGTTLTVQVEKAPAFLGGMVEKQLRQFFS